MADAVLPEPVFTPAIAVIRTGQNRAASKPLKQRPQAAIDPFQAGPLTTATLGTGAIGSAKRYAGARPALPGGTVMPIGHMGFAHVEEQEDRLIGARGSQFSLNPGQLAI